MKKLKILIVDDSAVVRQTLTEIVSSDNELEVIKAVPNPYAAVEVMKDIIPDVILLDIEMPKMDGITFLRKIMTQHPIPVVICSSLTENNAETTLKAMEYGAANIITKPKLGTKRFLEESRIRITDAVKGAAKTEPRKITLKVPPVKPKLTADAVLRVSSSKAMIKTTEKIVVIGASTGGTEAISSLLQKMPLDSPGIVIVQHMPEHFTRAFADRLDSLCSITVKEAENRDSIIRGQALIAPGNLHLLIKRSGANYYVEIKEGPLVSRHRPSVDVLFRSASRYAGSNAVGVILTGMGDDGAKGLKELHDTGAYTIAQDEKSCVVYGMPKEAVKLGGADIVLPLNEIPKYIIAKGRS